MTQRVFHLGIVLVIAMLQGCGADSKNLPASQVAARVNGGEITIYRVNSALAALPNADPQGLAQSRRGVLDSLIDQELAAQAAEAAKLDRTPAVMQAIESSRREVLARAWLQQLSIPLPKPDAAQVSRYYAEHPELFAQRRVFHLQQMMFTSTPEMLKEAQQKIDAAAPLQQIGQWLQEKQVKYTTAVGVRAAEQIPLDLLARLNDARDGETLLIEQPDAALIVHIVSSTPQPIDEATAAPRISKFLVNQAWTEAIAAEMKRLKQSATITYAGEFAADAPTLPPAAERGTDAATASLAKLEREAVQP